MALIQPDTSMSCAHQIKSILHGSLAFHIKSHCKSTNSLH